MTRSLSVWWDDGLVGTLILDQHGDLGFAYDPGWLANDALHPISQSLPKRAEQFNRRETRPFFAGLLPDEAQREAAARALGISERNDFRLLEALGGDVAGALTLWPQGEPPPSSSPTVAFQPLSDDEIIRILDVLPRRPLLAGQGGLRLSLAGAQPKLPVVVVDGRIGLPKPGQPTTHILKPPIPRFTGTTENEAFAMRLAASVNLPVAPVEPRCIKGRGFLLVARYDREFASDGSVHRLHQEDFCQALGIAPENKYASEGGPGFRQCFDLIRRACATPAPSVLRLLDAAIFNVLLGNADAHGKNFSLLYARQGVELAPLYDLLCTAAYPEVSAKFSMKIAKRGTLQEFRPDTWDEFAKYVGTTPSYLRRRVPALAARVIAQLPHVVNDLSAPELDADALASYAEIVRRRAERFTP